MSNRVNSTSLKFLPYALRFAKDGGVTAANSSSISDGASAMILVDSEFGRQENLQPLAKIVAYSTHARQPDEFTIAPVFAIETLLEKRAGTNQTWTFGKSMKPLLLSLNTQ